MRTPEVSTSVAFPRLAWTAHPTQSGHATEVSCPSWGLTTELIRGGPRLGRSSSDRSRSTHRVPHTCGSRSVPGHSHRWLPNAEERPIPMRARPKGWTRAEHPVRSRRAETVVMPIPFGTVRAVGAWRAKHHEEPKPFAPSQDGSHPGGWVGPASGARHDRRRTTVPSPCRGEVLGLVTLERVPPAWGQTSRRGSCAAVHTPRSRLRSHERPPRGGLPLRGDAGSATIGLPVSRRPIRIATARFVCVFTRSQRACSPRACAWSRAIRPDERNNPRDVLPSTRAPFPGPEVGSPTPLTRGQAMLAGVHRRRLRRFGPGSHQERAHLRGLLRRHVLGVSCALPRFHPMSFHGFFPLRGLPSQLAAC